MHFRDPDSVSQYLASAADADEITTAYALRSLALSATYRSDYVASKTWADAVVPTDAGRELLKQVSLRSMPRADVHLALFGVFWFQGLLVDASRSNLAEIRSTIQEESLARRFYWPMIHGRELYDRYNAVFAEPSDVFNPKETETFLNDTPIGIYQARYLVTGPLGILDSKTMRHTYPQQSVGLWHCPLLECRKLHGVRFAPPQIPLTEAYRVIETAAESTWGTAGQGDVPVAVGI
jgi:hypothetical protein